METMEAYESKVDTQLKHWAASLEQLIARAEKAGAEAKADLHGQIEELKTRQHVAQTRLAALTAAGHDKWEILKAGVDSACSELEAAFKLLAA